MAFPVFALESRVKHCIEKNLDLKNLNLNYNKAKIKNDPLNFKLLSRVIPYEFDYNTYVTDIATIFEVLPKIKHEVVPIGLRSALDESTYDDIKIGIKDLSKVAFNEMLGSSFAKDENLKLFVNNFIWRLISFDDMNLSKIGTLNVIKKLEYTFSKICGTLVFLTTEKSVATELFMSFYTFAKNSFEDLRELTDVKEILADDTKTELPIMRTSEAFLFVPLKKTGPVSVANPTGALNIKFLPMNPDNEIFAYNEVKRAYELGIEIMYYLYNTDTDLFEDIFEQCGTYFKKAILDCQSNGTLNEDNPKERFMKIKLYVDSIDLKNIKDLYLTEQLYVSELLQNLIEYAQNFAYSNYRIKFALLLIQYAKDNGIKLTEDMDTRKDVEVDDEEDDLEDDDDDDDEEDEDEEDDVESSEMYTSGSSKGYAHYDKIKAASSSKRKHKTEADGIEPALLDKAIGTFSANSYNYKIEARYTTSTNVDNINTYNKIATASKMITNNLTKQIKDIKCYNFGGKNSGKWIGKLDNKRIFLYKTQKNIFCDNIYKTKEMDPVFGIILDQSGSMCGKGIEDGRITMILLHEVLKSLGVNHSIIGHTSSGNHQATIFKYVAFKEDKGYTLNKAYNLAGIKAYNGNCDSGALYYMEQQLLRTKQKDKICIIFSDGEPTECTNAELVEQVRSMESKGIRVIGIGIDFESIVEYYPNNANGRNLKEMLDIICNLLKQYVLEKED